MMLLEVVAATKHFGRLAAVRDVSLAVPQGELRAVIGPNGAGKTTFFNLISGLFPPTAGRVVFDGRDVTGMPAHARVKLGMARTFQITEIFPELSVRENVRPRLLLLDEPTAGMGDQETYEITQLIRGLHRDGKLTIVLIEHDMRVVFHLADRITVLDQGKLLAEGTPQEIAVNDAVQAAYLGKAA